MSATYRQLAQPIIRLGYAALPRRTGGKGKAPAVKYQHLTGQTKAQNLAEMAGWDSTEPAALWLLDALAGSGAPDLDDVDVDNLAHEEASLRVTGTTPLTMTTGRDGGGRHHFYQRDTRRPRDEHGSIVRFLPGLDADWKTWHGYCVSPGSVHPSGRVYQLCWEGKPITAAELTREMLLSLPVLDRDVVEAAMGEAVEDATYVEMGFDRGTTRLKAREGARGVHPTEKGDPSAVFPAGAWRGTTVENLAARIGTGQTRVCCPHRAQGGAHRSDEGGDGHAILHAEEGDAAFLVCFCCSKTYTYGTSRSDWGQHFPSTTDPGSAGPTRVTLAVSDLTSEGWIDDARLFDALKKARVRKTAALVLQLGQGRGKTEFASRLVRAALRRGERVVGVTPTRSLSREQARRLTLPCYLDLPEEGALEGSVSVCLPSLRRCPSFRAGPDLLTVEDVGADLLVLDECEQQLRSLLGSHLTDAQARDAYSSLLSHVRSASTVLLMDADAGPLTEALLKAAGKLGKTAWVTGPAAPARNAAVWASRSEWLADLMSCAGRGQRVAVAVHSVEEAQVLARLLPVHEGLATACVTGETVGDYDLAHLDDVLAQRGHLVYTPVLGTGVSITLRDHFDRVYALLCDGVGTGADALQLVSRVRHPKDRNLRIGRLGGGRTPARWEREPAEVVKTWLMREQQTMRKVGFVRDLPADLATYADGTPAFRPDVVAYVRAVAAAHAENVQDGEGDVVDALCERLSGLGGKVFEVALPAKPTAYAQLCREMRKGVKEEVVVERVEAVVAAELPTEEEAEKVKRRGARTRKESDGIRKAGIEAFYGPGKGSDPDTVRWDDRGRGRNRARNLAHVVAAMEGGKALDGLVKLDRGELEAGVSAARLRHRSVRARALVGLLKRLGVDGGVREAAGLDHDEAATVVVDPEKALTLAKWARSEEGAVATRVLGITVRRDALENPMQLASAVVKACGLTLRGGREKARGGDRDQRTYRVDDVDEVLGYADAYLARLRRGEACDEGVEEEPEPETGLSPEAAEALLAELCAA